MRGNRSIRTCLWEWMRGMDLSMCLVTEHHRNLQKPLIYLTTKTIHIPYANRPDHNIHHISLTFSQLNSYFSFAPHRPPPSPPTPKLQTKNYLQQQNTLTASADIGGCHFPPQKFQPQPSSALCSISILSRMKSRGLCFHHIWIQGKEVFCLFHGQEQLPFDSYTVDRSV